MGLFSSAGIDPGTSLLLKVFSRFLDETEAAGKPLPISVLDAGCGCGIIGINAAAAITALLKSKNPQKNDKCLLVRSQDRDELARQITLHNAKKNNISSSVLEAYTELLLSVPSGSKWDLILTNIPAKTGTPVLEDFIRRSVNLLNPDGSVIMVAVKTLEDFFLKQITETGELVSQTKGTGHTVFIYKQKQNSTSNSKELTNICFNKNSFYFRTKVEHEIEDIPVQIESFYGASGFDKPGGAVVAAAKLVKCLRTFSFPVLIHEPAQGFFTNWLIEYFYKENILFSFDKIVLSGRNIIALEAAKYNTSLQNIQTKIIPAADLYLGKEKLLAAINENKYGCIIAFPEILPQSALPKGTDQLSAFWDSLPALLEPNGIFIAAFGSSEAERFDRKKPVGFTRLSSIKRDGFRALGYKY